MTAVSKADCVMLLILLIVSDAEAATATINKKIPTREIQNQIISKQRLHENEKKTHI